MVRQHVIATEGASLAVEESGEGTPVVLLHGLTATHRYVVMGSRVLERAGHRVISYDARAHGASSPAGSAGDYGYASLVDDLGSVLDWLDVERAVLAGASMGAHTLLSYALAEPERVGGLVVITPAYEGEESVSGARMERWDALAAGLRRGGVEGFVEAYGTPAVAPQYRETVLKVIRQRLSLHEHPDALADAIEVVPRSRPFGTVGDLGAISVPVAVVASNDDADPEHPFAVGEAYAAAIPGATLVSDQPGASPVAWQGSQLSHVIAGIAAQASW
jgi:3-oxoadipate enol-lactonase